MKKFLIGSALAVGLLVAGGGQSEATAIPQNTPIDLNSMDIETALMLVQEQRAKILEEQLRTQLSATEGGNSQQMDMLRLQSLSNKRNEAFDLMTNFIKKMQENRSSVIGNMR